MFFSIAWAIPYVNQPMVLNGCENRSLAKESLLIMASPENPLLEVREEINYGKK